MAAGGFSVGTNVNLIRANLWSTQIKEVLLEELIAMKYVDLISDFPDGQTLNIPSIGQAEALDYSEGQAIRYTQMDTGNFTFQITKYKSSATYITEQMKQDSFYMSKLISSFVPKQHRAIMKVIETDIFAQFNNDQTASNQNIINGAQHRWVAHGTNQVITPQDFALARLALQRANVPMTNLVAVVDATVEYTLSTLTNLVNVIQNPRWEGIVRDGMSTGTKFLFNIYGFDVYVTPNLLNVSAGETINGVAVNSSGVANVFFSAAPDVLPIVGSLRQPPKVDSDYNKDLQREEYVTTCRYGFKTYRPENVVCVLSATDQAT